MIFDSSTVFRFSLRAFASSRPSSTGRSRKVREGHGSAAYAGVVALGEELDFVRAILCALLALDLFELVTGLVIQRGRALGVRAGAGGQQHRQRRRGGGAAGAVQQVSH